ncbi:MAG: hypothetical protein DI533_17035 [Cereibacter sphaeroides]|uniref:Uncharacterized protein n=1 Tax=Cereibacter sphaeroides TaxID=1063 RepID=A0A2W5S525_CERSP|nr:MAG: hypothetical protein DI533_17035 [Cereibacter sphaeroides]
MDESFLDLAVVASLTLMVTAIVVTAASRGQLRHASGVSYQDQWLVSRLDDLIEETGYLREEYLGSTALNVSPSEEQAALDLIEHNRIALVALRAKVIAARRNPDGKRKRRTMDLTPLREEADHWANQLYLLDCRRHAG